MVDWNEENVLHLLSRAGFGAKPTEIKSFVKRGMLPSVAQLCFSRPARSRGPAHKDDSSQEGLDALTVWWFKRMATQTSRRLQEKMALFWHDHFASNFDTTKNVYWMALQNKTFRALGTGSFKTLVFEVTRDPAMLDFLDGKLNTKGKPNENYGRELMELFTLGVSDPNGNDNYTQTDVTQMARCLTGFQIVDDEGVFSSTRFDGNSKTLFSGKSYQVSGNIGVVDATQALLPGPQNLIDAIFGHTHQDPDSSVHRTMPRFIGKKLWEYFVYPDPDMALIDEVTASFIGGGNADTDYVISNLLYAIFTHDEFYSDQAKSTSVKNPVEFTASAIRLLRASTDYKVMPDQLAAMGMELFNPPSVNGWDNGLAWLSSGLLLNRFEFAQTLAAGRDIHAFKLDPLKQFDYKNHQTADLVVDDLINTLRLQSSIPDGARDAMVAYIGAASGFTKGSDAVERKVRGALALLLQLPEFHIH